MYNLEKILPHKPPMILLDDILEVNLSENLLIAKFDIHPKKIFFSKKLNGISSIAGIEFMAQAVGCYAYFESGCETPKPGLLLGARIYNSLIELFKNEESYFVKVSKMFDSDEIAAFDCLIYNEKVEAASATIKVYQSKNIRELLSGKQ